MFIVVNKFKTLCELVSTNFCNRRVTDSVASELLENLLRVSPARFEVIVLDVLHRLGYGGHWDVDLYGVPSVNIALSARIVVLPLFKNNLEDNRVTNETWVTRINVVYDAGENCVLNGYELNN